MWHKITDKESDLYKFQSTHPRRVWLLFRLLLRLKDSFNPHTHAGCDPVNTAAYTRIKVSIHTPTQGVTFRKHSLTPTVLFQSTHPRRVWRPLLVHLFISLCFNPHTHAGCDYWNKSTGRISAVSIHTPTQGVTDPNQDHLLDFLFQSTHPRRVWLYI